MPSFHALKTHYASALKRFIASPQSFEVLSSISPDSPDSPPVSVPVPPGPPSYSPAVLYVLDSSYNPPTLAHRRIASAALLENHPSSRLLLLLATQNADKPAKPAPFEDRLAMMELFAKDLLCYLRDLPANSNSNAPCLLLPDIDIGVTKKPYFIDKAAAIELAGVYPSRPEQVHLTGFDTLIRIFDPKYYPPEHTLQPLAPFLSQHRLRVTMRPDSEWGSRQDQEEFLRSLAQGGRENEGGRREWAERIQLVEGKRPEDRSVSSTKAREAVQNTPGDLEWLVPEGVREFLLAERPYSSQESSI